MSSEKTTVETELKVHDGFSTALEGAKHGFEAVHEKAQEVSGELAGMVKQSLAMAAGFQLNAGIEGIKEFGHEIFSAAMNAGAETKAIAGVLAINDKSGSSWEDLTERAKGYHEQLMDISVQSGVVASDVQEAFGAVAARSSKSAAEVADFVDTMAQAGRAVKGGIGSISEGFAMVEMGAIRARNPVVQMVAQMHVLKGNAKEVAKEMMKMKPEDALKLGEQAIQRMADKMKNVKPTFGEAVQSLKAMREQVMEVMGAPLLQAIKGPLLQFRDYLMHHRVEMEHYAKSAGEKIGEWAKDAATLMKDGFQYLQDHAEEIRDAIKEGWAYAKTVVEMIIANKDIIMMGLKVYAGAKLAGGLGGMAAGAMGVEGGAMGLIGKGIAGGAPSLGVAGGGLAAGALTFGALAAAIGAAGLAADQFAKLEEERYERKDEDADSKKGMQAVAESGDVEQVERMINSMRLMRAEENANSSAMGVWLDEALNMNNTLSMSTAEMEAFARQLQETASDADMTKSQVVAMLDDVDASADATAEGMNNTAAQVVDAYNFAQSQHSEAAIAYAAKFMLESGLTAKAITDAGQELEGGFEEFQERFAGAAGKTADLLKNFMGGGGGGKDMKIEAPQVHMGGGNTFNIKQDFRDQDPDRVALVFRRDVARAAESRRQSRMSTPFGL